MTTEAPGDAPDDDQDLDEDDEVPSVVLCRLRDLQPTGLGEKLAKDYADRPVWFYLEVDAELVTIFERIPEDPMPAGRSQAIMDAIRTFATAKSDDLQLVLGISDGISFGFHVDAPFSAVERAFEEDGFEIGGTVLNGQVVDHDGAEPPDA